MHACMHACISINWHTEITTIGRYRHKHTVVYVQQKWKERNKHGSKAYEVDVNKIKETNEYTTIW